MFHSRRKTWTKFSTVFMCRGKMHKNQWSDVKQERSPRILRSLGNRSRKSIFLIICQYIYKYRLYIHAHFHVGRGWDCWLFAHDCFWRPLVSRVSCYSLLRLNALWLSCIISIHSCMNEFKTLGKSWKPDDDTRCLDMHCGSRQWWFVILQNWHGYKDVWSSTWYLDRFSLYASRLRSVETQILRLYALWRYNRPRPRFHQERIKKRNSRPDHSHRQFTLQSVSVFLSWSQFFWAFGVHVSMSFRLLSSVLVTKILPCIPYDVVTLHISSVWLEISAQRLNVTDDRPSPLNVCTSTKGCRFWLIVKSDLSP